jgi:hypothetical protein
MDYGESGLARFCGGLRAWDQGIWSDGILPSCLVAFLKSAGVSIARHRRYRRRIAVRREPSAVASSLSYGRLSDSPERESFVDWPRIRRHRGGRWKNRPAAVLRLDRRRSAVCFMRTSKNGHHQAPQICPPMIPFCSRFDERRVCDQPEQVACRDHREAQYGD